MGSAQLDLRMKLEKDGGTRKPEIGRNGRRLGFADWETSWERQPHSMSMTEAGKVGF
jgi:hypothetical protein